MIGELTIELRWFFKGILPVDVQYWFTNLLPGNKPSKEESREDLYFIVSDREDLGLKISRGFLELKWRQDSQPFSLSASRIIGVEETWIKEKWRYAKEYANNVEMAFSKPGLKGSRVKVQKFRSMRKYQMETSGQVIDLAPGQTAVRVLKVELTSLTKHDSPWWTFALEISGEPQNLHEIFSDGVKIILNSHPQLDLQPEHSYGYPQWLARSD
ncbi:MAG: hypothetical protein ACLP7A_00960 [Desulfobaccales bacterium]